MIATIHSLFANFVSNEYCSLFWTKTACCFSLSRGWTLSVFVENFHHFQVVPAIRFSHLNFSSTAPLPTSLLSLTSPQHHYHHLIITIIHISYHCVELQQYKSVSWISADLQFWRDTKNWNLFPFQQILSSHFTAHCKPAFAMILRILNFSCWRITPAFIWTLYHLQIISDFYYSLREPW